MDRLNEIRKTEEESHIEAYSSHELFKAGNWVEDQGVSIGHL